jgi:ATP-dependent Clp protease ATP-binding subunit ClpA
MPRDLSKMTAEEKEALKARKKAYDAERQKEVYQRKKAQGIPLMAAPAPLIKKGMRSDYEENYGDFEPNYKVALAEAKALDYDIEEWNEAWTEEEARRKKGIPEEFSESDLREFAPYKNLLRNRNGDLLTKDYEFVGKLIIKVKGGKGVETIKRVEPPAYLNVPEVVSEERFAEIVAELAKPPPRTLESDNRKQAISMYKLLKEAQTQVFGRPLSIQEISERKRADETGYARLEDKMLKVYNKLVAEARPPSKIKLIEESDE